MEKKYRLHFLPSGDLAGLEKELNDMSAGGWQPRRIRRLYRSYIPGEGAFVYRIGCCLVRPGSADDITASAARQRAGWEEVGRRGSWLLLRKQAEAASPGEALPEGREETAKLLQRKVSRLEAARRWMLVLASLLLIIGYASSLRLMMLGCIPPLTAAMIQTYAIKHLEEGMRK